MMRLEQNLHPSALGFGLEGSIQGRRVLSQDRGKDTSASPGPHLSVEPQFAETGGGERKEWEELTGTEVQGPCSLERLMDVWRCT